MMEHLIPVLRGYKINIILTSSENRDIERRNTGNNNTGSKILIDDVNKVILIASGKGGVGKSTIAALLAQKLANDKNSNQIGDKKVGLLDADIYGPSIPEIFGINAKPELKDKRMIPLEKYRVKLNSIGFITDPEAAISWRGPMTGKALYQLISLTNWGKLDYLIIDTPPGTGDIHLSLLQNYKVSGVIMVTTPQKISAIDVQRAKNLYEKFAVPIIGIIENMSYYLPEEVSLQQEYLEKRLQPFSGSSGQDLAAKWHVPLLSSIPLVPGLSSSCDNAKILDNYFKLLNIKSDNPWF